ncbi:MAG TPA: class I SAM-dependent methyltransferase [Acidobacteriaceae bacterium]|nr:class I SAM-dependent methyltransferase [Acidobacteriaceae bacterium]
MNLINRALLCARAYTGLDYLNRRTENLLDKPKELVAECFGYCDGFLAPVQVPEEMELLLADVRQLAPKRILEIGTCKGGSLYMWTRLAQQDATVVSVDLPGGKYGGGYSKLRTPIYQRFARAQQHLHLLRANSHVPQTLENVKRIFGGQEVDFLFIDGDHSYEGVKQDWEMYSPLVRKGGLVVFHDVAGNYGETHAKRVWDDVKTGYSHREYMFHPEGFYGIGVLCK